MLKDNLKLTDCFNSLGDVPPYECSVALLSSSSLDPPEPCVLWLDSRLTGVSSSAMCIYGKDVAAFPFVYASEELELWKGSF